MAGLRYNEGKPRMDLIPWDTMVELALHYMIGAKKYSERNWEQGLPWNSGTMASLLRHAAAWSQGEDIDPENGQRHDVAILWNAVSLVTYRLRGIGIDDRPTSLDKEKAPSNEGLFYVEYDSLGAGHAVRR